jgi:hypothetical protein
MTQKSGSADNLFEFVLNDRKTCHSESDFKNPEARKMVKTWVERKKELENTRSQLDNLRDKYAIAADAQKQQFAAQIRLMEASFEKLLSEVSQTEKAIRKAESGQ